MQGKTPYDEEILMYTTICAFEGKSARCKTARNIIPAKFAFIKIESENGGTVDINFDDSPNNLRFIQQLIHALDEVRHYLYKEVEVDERLRDVP